MLHITRGVYKLTKIVKESKLNHSEFSRQYNIPYPWLRKALKDGMIGDHAKMAVIKTFPTEISLHDFFAPCTKEEILELLSPEV